MGSPVLAINRKQYAWIRGLISTPMQSFFFPGNKAICRDLEIMHFLGGRRYHSGSPENILSDWLVFYSPLSRPRVCCWQRWGQGCCSWVGLHRGHSLAEPAWGWSGPCLTSCPQGCGQSSWWELPGSQAWWPGLWIAQSWTGRHLRACQWGPHSAGQHHSRWCQGSWGWAWGSNGGAAPAASSTPADTCPCPPPHTVPTSPQWPCSTWWGSCGSCWGQSQQWWPCGWSWSAPRPSHLTPSAGT